LGGLVAKKEKLQNDKNIANSAIDDLTKRIADDNSYIEELSDEIGSLRDELLGAFLKNQETSELKARLEKAEENLGKTHEKLTSTRNELEAVVHSSRMEHEEYDRKLHELSITVSEIESLRSEMQTKKQIQQAYAELKGEYESLSKLWDSGFTDWKGRSYIESEVSPNALPFTAFLAIVSIERKLRDLCGYSANEHVKVTDYINNSNLTDIQKTKLKYIYELRNNWFHGVGKPSHINQYHEIVNLAGDLDATVMK
jgi:chromosome segregation ATPase